MAKDDSTNGGLFSKVVKFVRNPATNWTDLDQKESDRESSHSKQALKEMIERKRRNDFVRRREFDMLRKLRRREAIGGPVDGSARPSFFQSSMPSKPDDRAMTLKKIDEIEAQMSMQWWKTKHGGNSSLPPNTNFPNSSIDSAGPDSYRAGMRQLTPEEQRAHNLAYARTAPDDFANAIARGVQASPEQDTEAQAAAHDRAHAPTQAAGLEHVAPAPAAVAAAAPVAPPVHVAETPKKSPAMGGLAAAYEGGTTTGFSASKLFAVDVDELAHDPELEEAAIRFANSDDQGAEAGLLEALGPQGSRHQHEETWFALFDLYRATGQQERFENLAIDFAGKFDRSAPMWFSIPEMVSKMVANDKTPSEDGQKAHWRCPAIFGIQSLAALNAALVKAPAPWCLDWSALKSVEVNAVQPLTKLFNGWAAQQNVQLRFIGSDHLDHILKEATPSGKRDASHDAWRLRLESLRVTHRPDEFELAALDFCVTYELSPPAWENARCEFKSLDASGDGIGNTIIGDVLPDSINSNLSAFADSQIDGGQQMIAPAMSAVELSGQIQGDAAAALAKLEARFMGMDYLVIACAKLIRVDFSAAGTLLNWVSARQAEGRAVHFTDVHRLVAAFFHVIGINEHAKVTQRFD